MKGIRFSDPLKKAGKFRFRGRRTRCFIALTHIGFDQDLLLARQMPELDVIIGGHSHTRVDPAEIVNGVLVAQAGSDNLFLGRVDLLLRDGRVVEKKGRLIDLSKVRDEDTDGQGHDRPVQPEPGLRPRPRRSPVGDQRQGRPGQPDDRRHPPGPRPGHRLPEQRRHPPRTACREAITLKDVYTLDPFGNQVVEIVMTPTEIRGLITTASRSASEIDLQVSGITYIVRTDGERQIREILLRAPGRVAPLPEDRTYKVGLSSYIASSYDFAHRTPAARCGPPPPTP